MHRCLRLLITLLAVAAFAQPAKADDKYPSRSIRIVIPYPAGGGPDVVIRTLSESLARSLGQPVIVDNRPGAATIIGAEMVAKAMADGHTLLVTNTSTIVVNPLVYRKLPYSPDRDFVAVTQLARVPLALVVNAQSPDRRLDPFLERAKAAQPPLAYASFGIGSTSHLWAETLSRSAGLTMNHIPYKGATQGLQELIGGQVDLMFADFASASAMIKAGKLRAIAVTGTKRVAPHEDVPTFAEQGLKGLESVGWFGVFAPVRTPADVLARLEKAFAAALAVPENRRALLDLGVEPSSSTGADFKRTIESDQRTWAPLIQAARIQIE